MRVNQNLGDALLHPVRLRIVQALVNQPLTATQLMEALGDVAQATLYRHIKQLEETGLIEVVAERPVRGGIERTFGAVTTAIALDDDDLAEATGDDHFRYFATFVGALLGDFGAYLASEPDSLTEDRVGYRQAAVWLSDDELDALIAELGAAVQARIDHEPAPGRRRRLITSILMPDART